jgi:hypothetical protein
MSMTSMSKAMHVYLLVKPDHSEAFCYTSLSKAKQKERELTYQPIVWEWMECWCRPLLYVNDSDSSGERAFFDDSQLPLNMLKLAYDSGNWFGRAKYPQEEQNGNRTDKAD